MLPRLFIIILFATLAMGCNNDIAPSEVPSVVENTSKSNFPDATDVEWETIKDDFKVDFEINGTDHSARINHAGTLLGHKYEITRGNLPSAIITTLNKEYPLKKWEDPEILVHGEKSYYQLEIDGFLNDKKVVLDSAGNKIENIKYWDQ